MRRIDDGRDPSVALAPGRRPATSHQDRGKAPSPIALQQRAGNRAMAQLLTGATIQRHEGPTTNDEVGGATEAADPAVVEAGTEAEAEATTEASPAPEPAPGTGTTGPAGVGLTGDARKKAIEDTLRASATGMWAMGVITKWKIPVDYEYAGTGSYHQDGKVFINKNLGVGAAAIVMMHEAQHAETFKSGKAADREKLSRADYIRIRIADEAEAVVRQIEGLAVTAGLGVDMAGNPITAALKERYLKAFYAKRDALTAANPGMSTAEVNAASRLATRDGEVTNWFHDGTFVTSTDNNNYAVFYGKQWDDVHKAPRHVSRADVDLTAVALAVGEPFASRLLDGVAHLDAVDVPGMSTAAVWSLLDEAGDRPLRVDLGVWPDGTVRTLTADQDTWADLVASVGVQLTDAAQARAYVEAFLERTRGSMVIVRVVTSLDDLRWRPGSSDEEDAKASLLADPPDLAPVAEHVEDGYHVELALVVDQRLQRNTFDVTPAGAITSSYVVLADGLPLPIAR